MMMMIISFLHLFVCLYGPIHQHSHLVDGIGDDDGVVDDDDDHGDDVDNDDDIHDISFLHVFVCLYSFVHQHSHGVDGVGIQLSCTPSKHTSQVGLNRVA